MMGKPGRLLKKSVSWFDRSASSRLTTGGIFSVDAPFALSLSKGEGQQHGCRRRPCLFLLYVIGYFLAIIPVYVHASQDLSASGGPKPISGINWTWLDRIGGTSTWGRNPFNFPRKGPTDGMENEGGLQLTAILYHKAGSVAIINQRIVRPGDSVGSRTVASILEDRVVLKDLNGVLELKLGAFGTK